MLGLESGFVCLDLALVSCDFELDSGLSCLVFGLDLRLVSLDFELDQGRSRLNLVLESGLVSLDLVLECEDLFVTCKSKTWSHLCIIHHFLHHFLVILHSSGSCQRSKSRERERTL